MRLIRSAVRPASISLPHLLRLPRVPDGSNETRTPEIFRMQNGCNMWGPGRSYRASSARLDIPPVKHYKRRLSRNARGAIVEDYVIKYMSMQDGKFPTCSEVVNYAGGGHYLIKNILEELKYKYKNSSSDQRIFLVEKDAVEMAEKKNDKPKDINLTDETKYSLHSDPEINIKHETQPEEDKVKFGLQAKFEQQQSTDSHKSERESNKEPSEHVPEKKSTVWQNLKSFASGLFGRWG